MTSENTTRDASYRSDTSRISSQSVPRLRNRFEQAANTVGDIAGHIEELVEGYASTPHRCGTKSKRTYGVFWSSFTIGMMVMMILGLVWVWFSLPIPSTGCLFFKCIVNNGHDWTWSYYPKFIS